MTLNPFSSPTAQAFGLGTSSHQRPKVDHQKVEALRARGVVIDSRQEVRRSTARRSTARPHGSTSSTRRHQDNTRTISSQVHAGSVEGPLPAQAPPAAAPLTSTQAVLERIAAACNRLADAQELQAASQQRSERLLQQLVASATHGPLAGPSQVLPSHTTSPPATPRLPHRARRPRVDDTSDNE